MRIYNRKGLAYFWIWKISRLLLIKWRNLLLINKDRSRIKVFEPFENVSKPLPTINAIMISYCCIYKRSSKPVMKVSRVEIIEAAREEYKKLLEEGFGKKLSLFKNYF